MPIYWSPFAHLWSPFANIPEGRKHPKCGCEVLGNGKGTLECDTAVGYFRRTCVCGWYVEVKEGHLEEPVTDLRPELLLEEEDEDGVPEEPTISEEPAPVPEPKPEPEPSSDTHTHTHNRRRLK